MELGMTIKAQAKSQQGMKPGRLPIETLLAAKKMC